MPIPSFIRQRRTPFTFAAGQILDGFINCTFITCLFGSIALGQAMRAQTNTEVPEYPSSKDQANRGSLENPAVTGLQNLLSAGLNDWSIFTEATFIDQGHGGFPAAYHGPNSFQNTREVERTFSYSLYLDRRLWRGGELVFNPEIFQGHGLSETLGVAGFPNGEAVKSGFPNFRYNTSRLFLRHVIGLGGEKDKLERDVNQVSEEVDVNRLTLSVGKFSANDFFDGNTYAHDPRTQFMNWSLWESTGWDYPADAVGFTSGMVVEWNTPNTTLHYGIFLEPNQPNGFTMDMHLAKAHGQILQHDYRYKSGSLNGTVRSFAYWNQANMGNFARATETATATGKPVDIAATRAYRSKVGFGVSWDQELATNLGAFARISWNDGRSENWAFTQVDRSIAAGLSVKGGGWNRPDDVFGLGIAVDGLSPEQRDYLAVGGTGLIVGDGALRYHTEQILETYYAFQAQKWLQLSIDYQYIRNPAYNADRGPVSIYAVRAHVQF